MLIDVATVGFIAGKNEGERMEMKERFHRAFRFLLLFSSICKWCTLSGNGSIVVGAVYYSYSEMPRDCTCLLERNRTNSLFAAARAELREDSSLPALTSLPAACQQPPTSPVEDYRWLFFHCDKGVDSFGIAGKVISNVVVFKVNSEGIFSTLQQAEGTRPSLLDLAKWNRKRIIYNSPNEDKLVAKLQQRFNLTTAAAQQHAEGHGVFAFVRDPLSHFLSGVAEANFRKLRFGARPPSPDSAEYKHKLLAHRQSVGTARATIQGMLSGCKQLVNPHVTQHDHYYRLAFALSKWRPAFIGHLETFEQDWARMVEGPLLGLPAGAVPLVAGEGHPTQGSGDPLHMKQMLRQLLQGEPSYLRAVCWLLILDYHCLGYALPEGCQDLWRHPQWLSLTKECAESS